MTIGHVHLRTADIDRVRGFYVGVLGFDVMLEARDVPGWGTHGRHPLRLRRRLPPPPRLQHVEVRAAAAPQPDGVAGLHHVAIRYPTRAGLADALRRLRAVDWPIRQASDHGTHEAIYISDPDGNDLELCWDRPHRGVAARRLGRLGVEAFGDLDLDALLAEEPAETPGRGSPRGGARAAPRRSPVRRDRTGWPPLRLRERRCYLRSTMRLR